TAVLVLTLPDSKLPSQISSAHLASEARGLVGSGNAPRPRLCGRLGGPCGSPGLLRLLPLAWLSLPRQSPLPSVLHPLSLVGIVGGLLYIVFRDSCGKGTSLGKRWLGLRIIDLQTGVPCSSRRVWARNLFDLIPILNTVDFILMCLDSRGQKLMD